VDSKNESRALRASHAAFYLSDQTLSVGILGMYGIATRIHN